MANVGQPKFLNDADLTAEETSKVQFVFWLLLNDVRRFMTTTLQQSIHSLSSTHDTQKRVISNILHQPKF